MYSAGKISEVLRDGALGAYRGDNMLAHWGRGANCIGTYARGAQKVLGPAVEF